MLTFFFENFPIVSSQSRVVVKGKRNAIFFFEIFERLTEESSRTGFAKGENIRAEYSWQFSGARVDELESDDCP